MGNPAGDGRQVGTEDTVEFRTHLEVKLILAALLPAGIGGRHRLLLS
jgi:hypothetical protein